MTEQPKNINAIHERDSISTDPLRTFRFRATFTPVAPGSAPGGSADTTYTTFSGGFSTIRGLGIGVETIEYREGGYNSTAHKIPGLAKFEPLTFSRGTIWGNDAAINWMRTLFAVSSGEGISGGANGKFRCNITISVMEHPQADGSTNGDLVSKLNFYVRNAWISALAYSDLQAGASEILFESMTVQHEGLSVLMPDENGSDANNTNKPSWV